MKASSTATNATHISHIVSEDAMARLSGSKTYQNPPMSAAELATTHTAAPGASGAA
jgi:hypothetical protein